jgi:hypothetical protein
MSWNKEIKLFLIHYVRTIVHQKLVETKLRFSLYCVFSFCLVFVYLCGCARALVWGFKFGHCVFFVGFEKFKILLACYHLHTWQQETQW